MLDGWFVVRGFEKSAGWRAGRRVNNVQVEVNSCQTTGQLRKSKNHNEEEKNQKTENQKMDFI